MRIAPLFLLLPLVLAACSGGGPASPEGGEEPSPQITTVPAPVGQVSATGILGGYSLSITGSAGGPTAELTPLRGGALGQSFTVSGGGFFTGLCGDCLEVTGIRREGAGLAVQLHVKHPFPAGDTGLPPSGQNRLDLDVFDLRLFWTDVVYSDDPFGLTNIELPAGLLSNADGYSDELANAIGDPAALPYVLVVDDAEGAGSTNNRFAMGSEADVEALLGIAPGETRSMQLYLTMGYGASATRPTRLSPQYFLPEFNQKAAWRVDVTAPPATFGQTWTPGDNVTPYPIDVAVYDWQVGATVDPNLDEPTDVTNASEVAEVSVEIPGMTPALTTVTTPLSGSGMPGSPLLFQLMVPNTNQLAAGTYTGVVRVTDTRTPGTVSAGGDPDTLVHTEDGATLNWFNIPAYATYQTFTAHVLQQANQAPTVGAVAGCAEVIANHPFDFSVTANDPDTGQTLTYQWDNGQNTPGVFDDATTLIPDVTFTFATTGTPTVSVQVNDGIAAPVVSSDPLEITVLPDGVFVDADFGGVQSGTWTNPWNTIIAGIANSTAGSVIYVEPATANYVPPVLQSNRSVVGFDRSCMGERPTINITTPVTMASGLSTITLKNLIFNYAVTTGSTGLLLRFQNTTNLTFDNCKFTGFSTLAPPSEGGSRYLALGNVDTASITRCEFVDIEHRMPATSNRFGQIININDGSDNVTVRNNEFHQHRVPRPWGR